MAEEANSSNKIKKLQELTIKHNFMFCAVMMDPETCRLFLERALDMQITCVEVNRERSFIYNPDKKSVVLDIYAKDENNTHYDVEMQTVSEKELPRRARYYHSQMDMELLESGRAYEELPNAYVIFVCDFDPFHERKYRYTCATYCRETGKRIEDGRQTVFLSTVGQNPEEVPKELVNFWSLFMQTWRTVKKTGTTVIFTACRREWLRLNPAVRWEVRI